MKRAWRFFGGGAVSLARSAQIGAGKGEEGLTAGPAVSLRIPGENAISRLPAETLGSKVRSGRFDAAQAVSFSLPPIDITAAVPESFAMIDAVPAAGVPPVEPMDAGRARAFTAQRNERLTAGRIAGRSGALEPGAIPPVGFGSAACNVAAASGQGRRVPGKSSAVPTIPVPSTEQPGQARDAIIAIRQTQDASNQDFPQAHDDNRVGACLPAGSIFAADARSDTRSARPSTPMHARAGSTVDGHARQADGMPPAIPAAREQALSGVFTLHPADHARLGACARARVDLTGGRRMPALS